MQTEERRVENRLHVGNPGIRLCHLSDEEPQAKKNNQRTERYGNHKYRTLKRSETSFLALAPQNMASTTESLPRDAYKQEEIANICDGDAPGIVIDDERSSHSVVIV